MLQVYPFGSGSFYTASYAVTASFAGGAAFIATVYTASKAAVVLEPTPGSRGKGVCLLTTEQYQRMLANPSLLENCDFS